VGETAVSRAAPASVVAVLSLLALSACGDGEGGPTTPEPGAPSSALIDRVEIVSAPAANGTYLDGEELVFAVLVTSGEEVETTGEVFLIFDLGLASEPAALSASEAGRLEFRYRIRRGDYDGDGISIPEGELMLGPGASLRIGGADLDREVREVPADPGHRVFARYSPGEALAFDTMLDRFPLDSLGLDAAIGCAAIDDFIPIVEAVLEANAAGAAALFQVAWQTGRCATLTQGAPAIFLSAAVSEHRGETYDLVLAYGPGVTLGGEEPPANWWTLADFLTEP
jgi:hypothetical protein